MVSRLLLIAVFLIVGFGAVQIVRLQMLQHAVFEAEPSYAITPENATLEVVEFIDYSCPFSQSIHPTIMEAVERDGRVRYVPKPLPTDNTRSMNAAMIAYAAGRQGKFMEMHNELISDFPNLTNEKVTKLAMDLGLDEEQYNQDIASEELRRMLDKNGRLYLRYDTGVTPTFIIGRKMIYVPEGTMPTVDDFLDMFEEARERNQ